MEDQPPQKDAFLRLNDKSECYLATGARCHVGQMFVSAISPMTINLEDTSSPQVHKGQSPSVLLTVADLADLLKVSKATIHDWLSRGGAPPHYRIGKSPRFDRRQVQIWMDERHRPATTPMPRARADKYKPASPGAKRGRPRKEGLRRGAAA